MRTIVVGAGGGGIASALLASLRGEKVTLLEAHSHVGGCASYFKRGPFIFDAGATTLSGVASHEPLGELFALLKKTPAIKLADPGIVFHLSSGKILHYHHDFEAWMKELETHFPYLNHRPFWERMRTLNERGWKLLKDMKSFPFASLDDLVSVLKYPEHLLLLPNLAVSMEMVLQQYGLDNKEYLELIDGILIISAQTTARDTPLLVGAMGLSYPAETYVPVGGMKGLMDFFEEELSHRSVEIKKRHKITSFRDKEVTLKDGSILKADRLILNLPVWNLAALSEEKLHPKLKREANRHPGFWGSFILYLGTKSQEKNLYHQVHLNHLHVKNYFVSFSLPEDRTRAPEGWQAVTISTHEVALEWNGLDEEEYEKKKSELQKIILDDFLARFLISEIQFPMSGTPKTFEDYTGRKSGFVGGLPFVFGKNPFSLLGATLSPHTFRVGDTIFPGQGLPGVVAGALQLHKKLFRTL